MLKASLKHLLRLSICTALGFCILFNGNIKDSYYRNEVGDHVVRIYNLEETGGGTGFHIIGEKSGEQFILTNSHVCEAASPDGLLLVEQNGEKIERKVIEHYKLHDLCLVEPMPEHEGGIDIAGSLDKGEDTIIVGHPSLRQLTLSHGEYIGKEKIQLLKLVDFPKECKGKLLEGLDGMMILLMTGKYGCLMSIPTSAISNPSYPGNSGSPVVNKYGNVVGVLFAGNRSQVHDSYMVPLKYIKDFLKDL
jgi:hypothetical protein